MNYSEKNHSVIAAKHRNSRSTKGNGKGKRNSKKQPQGASANRKPQHHTIEGWKL
jgi:hypothetical protein